MNLQQARKISFLLKQRLGWDFLKLQAVFQNLLIHGPLLQQTNLFALSQNLCKQDVIYREVL